MNEYQPYKNVKKLTLTAVNKFLDYYTNGSYDQNTAIKIWQNIKDDEHIQEDWKILHKQQQKGDK